MTACQCGARLQRISIDDVTVYQCTGCGRREVARPSVIHVLEKVIKTTAKGA